MTAYIAMARGSPWVVPSCIEHATMLRANIMHIMQEYKAGEGVSCCSRLIN